MTRMEPVWLRRGVLLLALAWPLSLHYAILFASPAWPPRVTAAAAALAALAWAAAAATRRSALVATAAALLLGAILELSPQLLLFAPPVIINGALAAVFGASLRSGREPLIAMFARLEQGGDLPADLARHARLVTWCWTVLLSVLALAALALAVWASLATWSLFTNVLGYALLAALFAGEYLYRRLRFRHYRHASLLGLLRNVVRSSLLARR